MSEPKFGPSDFQKEVDRLKAEGKFPTLEEVLSAVQQTRAEYREKILAARQGKKKA